MPFKFLQLNDYIKPARFFSNTLTASIIFSINIILFLQALAFASLRFYKEQNVKSETSVLKELNFHKSQNYLEVEILFNRYTIHRKFELTNPNRIVIDFFNVRNIQAPRYLKINDFGIKTVRAGIFKPFVVRVVFDIQQKMPRYKVEKIQGGLKVSFTRSSGAPTMAIPVATTTTAPTTTTTTTTRPKTATSPKAVPTKISTTELSIEKPSFLKEINLQKTKNSLEVKILFNRYTIHRKFELANPNRIVVDFFNVKNIQARRYTEINDFGIKGIRAGRFKPFIARVVFDLEEKIPFYKIERIQGGLKVSFTPSYGMPTPGIPSFPTTTTAPVTTTTTTSTSTTTTSSTTTTTTTTTTTSTTTTTTTIATTTTAPTTTTTTTTIATTTTAPTTTTTTTSTSTTSTRAPTTTTTTTTITTTTSPTTTTTAPTTTSTTTTVTTTTTTTTTAASTTTTTTTLLPPPPPPPTTTTVPTTTTTTTSLPPPPTTTTTLLPPPAPRSTL